MVLILLCVPLVIVRVVRARASANWSVCNTFATAVITVKYNIKNDQKSARLYTVCILNSDHRLVTAQILLLVKFNVSYQQK